MQVQLAIKDGHRSLARGIGATAFKDNFKLENLRTLVIIMDQNFTNIVAITTSEPSHLADSMHRMQTAFDCAAVPSLQHDSVR